MGTGNKWLGSGGCSRILQMTPPSPPSSLSSFPSPRLLDDWLVLSLSSPGIFDHGGRATAAKRDFFPTCCKKISSLLYIIYHYSQALPKTILARRPFLIQKFGASRREIQNSKMKNWYMATDWYGTSLKWCRILFWVRWTPKYFSKYSFNGCKKVK